MQHKLDLPHEIGKQHIRNGSVTIRPTDADRRLVVMVPIEQARILRPNDPEP